MPKNVLAADVGGTNVRVALVDADGQILLRRESETPKRGSANEICELIAGIANEILREGSSHGPVKRFGLALPAIIDYANGSVLESPNLPHLNGFEIGPHVADKTGLGVKLENDATAATIGEHWLGAGRGANNVIGVTLGTGVGGGLIIEGEVFRGIDGTAGEVGHICVEPEGPLCACGSHGCVEQFASATAIVRQAKERLSKYPSSLLNRSENFTAEDVFFAAKDGDELSIEVFETAGRYLGIALAGLINVLNPDVIFVGGGASSAWELFIGQTLEEVEKRAFQRPAERVKIVLGQLGDDAGIMGAAKVVIAHADKGSS
jgi:glucokinase